MTQGYEALLTPFELRHLRLRNRVMMTAHVTNMAPLHEPTEQHVAYYRDRARGGIGLIVMGFPAVHPAGVNNAQEIAGYDPRIVPGLRSIADAVHEHDTPIIAQLGHAGRQANSAYTMQPLMAPSAIPCPVNREMPKAMEPEDLDEVVKAHALTAGLVRESGMDGVEIHSAYGGYLLSSFLSPYMNERDDEYGGSLDDRLRLPLRVVHAVRERVGPDYVVGMQINGHDFSPGGLELPDAQVIAQRLVATGALDYLVIKGSTYFVADQNVPDWQHPRALWLPLAAGVKQAVGEFPVFAVGRLDDPAQANEVIERGQADMVAMTRQHISDPETVRKLVEGRPEDVRGCISCNQGCLDMLAKGRHITCVQNPAAGYERELGIGTLKAAEAPRRVVVIGAGPAGLKVAETAARRGHDVRLVERRERVGGQVRLASTVPGREEIGEVVRHLETQVDKLDIDLRCGVTVQDADDELLRDADEIVVTTGSRPVPRLIGVRSHQLEDVAGLEESHVLDSWDLLERGVVPGHSVLVVDDGEGGWKALSIAAHLARTGHAVQLATPLPFVAAGLGPYSIGPYMRTVFDLGIVTHPFTIVRAVTPTAVELIKESRPATLEGLDSVVLCGWHEPVDDLYFDLKRRGVPVGRAGDAVAARTIMHAIHEAERVARAL
jgi:2,4-dienoyl-CoA reductase-like NADH-dependent reductase (Old Yellow Enzyme family)